MKATRVFGTSPWLPWPLSTLPWWTQPIPAERLAALRIGLGLVLLFDIAAGYFPLGSGFFAAGAPAGPDTFAANRGGTWAVWTFLAWGDGFAARAALWLWAAAALGLTVGLASRFCAATCWAISLSFIRLCPYVHNAGDVVRTILLFYLMLAPCGAAWSLDARRRGEGEQVLIHPWPIRLVLIQLAIIYFLNGVYKWTGPEWQSGDVMHYVLADLTVTRWSRDLFPVPVFLTRALSWLVASWETAFPFLLFFRRTRPWALGLGLLLHVGLLLFLDLGAFPVYMLCCYLPLAPWERVGRTKGPDAHAVEPVVS